MVARRDDWLGLGLRSAWWQRLLDDRSTYECTRWAILRLLSLVYLAAFASLAVQVEPLLGSHGLLPAASLLARERATFGASAVWRSPTVFWLSGPSDGAMRVASWAGVALSAAGLAGATNALVQLALWILYVSFVHVGQIFFGYGWELQLLETGFLAVFLCPIRGLAPYPPTRAPPLVILLFRWLAFRVMVGSALIKLRHDACWVDLTCLDYHFETQPSPNPLSWWLHRAPHFVHSVGGALTLVVELVVPLFVFGFRGWRHVAGALLFLLQLLLIASGNLSFLNWLTLVPTLACFDDTAFLWCRPAVWRFRKNPFASAPSARGQAQCPADSRSRPQERAARVLAVVVVVLSVAPVINMVSCDQSMNRSFEPLGLVNSYGAFGDVDRARFEVILEGTADPVPDDRAHWVEYELPCMPGDPHRRPCLAGPYHYRLDWQMWFIGNGAAKGEAVDDEPWLVHLVWKLLEGGQPASRLLAREPFPRAPPRWIRADIWRYRFTKRRLDGWWVRERAGTLLRPVSLDDSDLAEYVRAQGWTD